jgi:excinuclease ABC subunit B
MTGPFTITSDYDPTGDQPQAIADLVAGVRKGRPRQTLLGATGTGKTFTMANVIAETGKPSLIISHNKTLAAQLYEEMRELFPQNAVSYFVSYYDYFQPEAYIPQRDIYIEKDASRNDDLDRLRLKATSSLLARDDVIVIASVSCIYGLGSPDSWVNRMISISKGQEVNRRKMLLSLADMQYRRNDLELNRACFRVRGDVVEVHPAYEQHAIRIEFFGDTVERLELIHPVSGETLAEETDAFIFPAVHYVLPEDRMSAACRGIREELAEQLAMFQESGKLLEGQRLAARTRYDLEMLQEVGFCPGIENYARHLEDRPPGSRPFCLLDYFNHVPGRDADDWLVFIDESHVTVPQIRAMHNGDRARKQVLVNHGFRLPSALDNRPLTFDEFDTIAKQVVYVSATPSDWELEQCGGEVVEQVIRPTGLLDPIIEVRSATGQVPDLVEATRQRAARGERVLATVLTKRLAEDLAAYLADTELRCRYLHSDIDTLDRLEILRDLRLGEFDVLVGVNLLREGLDLPEVSLVCILDADKTGFLRSRTSLIQTIGRAARHVDARVILYADTITSQMQQAMDETNRRRELQMAYNETHGIEAVSVQKAIHRGIETELRARHTARAAFHADASDDELDVDEQIELLEQEMVDHADRLDFEKAAVLRDRIAALRRGETPSPAKKTPAGAPGTRPRLKRRRS